MEVEERVSKLDGFDAGCGNGLEFGNVAGGGEDASTGGVEGEGEGRAETAVGAVCYEDGAFGGLASW